MTNYKTKIIDGVEYKLIPTGKILAPELKYLGIFKDGGNCYYQFDEYKKIKVGDKVSVYGSPVRVFSIYKQGNRISIAYVYDEAINLEAKDVLSGKVKLSDYYSHGYCGVADIES